MAEADLPDRYPAFWLSSALIMPLAIGGLCLVGFALLAEVLLVLVLDPFLADVTEGWRGIYLHYGQIGWDICILVAAIVIARFAIRRIDGGSAGILSDLSLIEAMVKDHGLYVWWLLAFIFANLGDSAIRSILDVDLSGLSPFFLVFLGTWLTLRFVGLAIKRAQPELWPAIQARAARKNAWPSLKMLALLLSVAAVTLFVGFLPQLLVIWSLER